MQTIDNLPGREITEAIRAGSRDIFDSFYRVEFLNVLHFVKRYLGYDDSVAEDIAQESFVSVWQTREKLDSNYSIRTYLYTIARNKTMNHLRDMARAKANTLAGQEALVNLQALNHESVTEKIDALELQQMIDRIYLTLPDKVVTTFRLSRVDGLTYKEIAEKMNISVKMVEYYISIALKRFRTELAHYTNALTLLLTVMLTFIHT
ncbi:MAG: RNA polymerase sigma-70 factor [Bacteroidales bacterium]|nr:RNA polymerase sigma-70 factor [Bacteroidales bacterium]